MSTQDVLAGQRKSWLPGETPQIRKRPPILVNLTLMLFLVVMLFVFGVVLTARAEPAPQLLDLDLPQAYLPGSPMPEDVLFYSYAPYETLVRSSVMFRGKEIILKFDANTDIILQVTIQTQELPIGELVAAWGTPTGIVQTNYMTSVHWGTGSAYLYTDTFQPNSRVDFIQHDLEPQRTSPWRGFRRHGN